jgi:broad specificity phosphatase PhoE
MSRFVIVRHGNTFEAGEPPRRIGARTDLPLTAAGRAQAEALGRHFAARDLQFTRVLSGPLARARDTARLLLPFLETRPPVETAAFLNEVDHGPDENQPEEAVLARIGAEALRRWDDEGLAPAGWQVDRDMRLAAWRQLFAETPADGQVLLVTSNGAARFALLAAGLARGGLKLRTGAWGIIEAGRDGALRLVEWDRRPE